MKQKLLCLLLTLLLVLGLGGAAMAESELWHITDSAGILSTEDDLRLEEMAAEISQRYGCGIYVITIDDYTDYYDDVYETAYQIYHAYSLGEGTDRNGALLLLSMDNRKYATFFYGPRAEYAFDKYGRKEMESAYLDDFKNDEWAAGFEHFISVCGIYLGRAASGDPVRRNPWSVIAVLAAVSCAAALVICLVLRAGMKSVHAGVQADEYVAGGLVLAGSSDQYTHTTRTERKIENDSSSGGGSDRSGGGGSGRSGSF